MKNVTLIVPLLCALLGGTAHGGVIPRDVSLAPVVKRVSPAVVNISTRGTVEVRQSPMFNDPMFRRFFNIPEGSPQRRETGSLGSGVIVDADKGLILTNHHVVAQADEITVLLEDGRQFSAELVGSDEDSDIAVLKIEVEGLSEIDFGDSEILEVGDYVLAVGNPFGLGHTVTSGIVSAKGRSGLGIENYEDFIQTDAAINRGNSGGALVNLQGELIGINTAILGPGGGNAGIGFAIPSRIVRGVMSQILEFGEVARGLLGIQGQAVDADIAESFGLKEVRGAIITLVQEDSSARKAGLKEDDVIVAVDGRGVDDFQDLRNTVGLRRPGDTVELTIIRDGRTQKLSATLGAYEQLAQARPTDSTLGGARLGAIPDDHPLAGEAQGVMVEAVEHRSNAQRAGLQRGDVITHINKRPVSNVAQAAEVLGSSEGRYLIKVRRGGAVFLVVID